LDLSKLVFSSASEAAQAIRELSITSFELTKHILKRIDQYNPELNAIVTLMREEALERARAADEALRNGEWWGPLHGIPITIKDCFEVSGVRTTAGSPSLKVHVPENDAVAVARLREAGAVILGHTNVPIMAGDWQSYNRVFGTTNNPWDLERTPGGSTGGGAAAVAAGLSFLSLGSDIGGSIRVPSHFCGVYGHKPSLNVVPLRGHIPPPPGGPPDPPPYLPVAGLLARSAEDLKMAVEILGGPDTEDAKAYQWTLPSARGKSLSDYRLGYVLDHPACPVSSDVKEVIKTSIEALRSRVDVLEEGWPPGVEPVEQYTTYRFLLASVHAGSLRDDEYEETRMRALGQDGSYEPIIAKAWTAPHKHFQAEESKRMTARALWQEYYETHDAFLLPVSFLPSFPHDHSHPFWDRRLPTTEGPRRYEDLLFWISFATLTGLPATIAPIGSTRDGLPVGIQIMGPYLEDATPIDVAAKISEVTGRFRSPEGYRGTE
jgi:amidase